MRLAWLLIALAVPTSAHAESDQEAAYRLMRRPPAELEQMISVKGDNLDPGITVQSSGVTQITRRNFGGLLGSYQEKNAFLRASIDRETGAVQAQIYHTVHYFSRDWSFYTSATYEIPGGAKQVELTKIGSDVRCESYGCWFDEVVGVPLTLPYLELVASRYNPASPIASIRYRLFARSGQTVDGGIPINEVVAFVNVVHRMGGRTQPIAQAAEPAPAVQPPDQPEPRPAKPAKSPPPPRVRCITCH